ncbi:MAG TPA: PaaI family thioesterase [Minicystis sp.]|nr:PaaI family thioesterase [Minicystis sp.]
MQRPFDPAVAGWELSEGSTFIELVGPIWRRRDGERVRHGLLVDAKHLNRAGTLHGGMLSTFADFAMSSVATRATGGKPQATIELVTHFLDPVQKGEFVEAHCKALRATRAVAFVHAKMFVGRRAVASASGIWKILDQA